MICMWGRTRLKEVSQKYLYQILMWFCNTGRISEIITYSKEAMSLLSPVNPVRSQPRQAKAKWAVSDGQPLERPCFVWCRPVVCLSIAQDNPITVEKLLLVVPLKKISCEASS